MIDKNTKTLKALVTNEEENITTPYYFDIGCITNFNVTQEDVRIFMPSGMLRVQLATKYPGGEITVTPNNPDVVTPPAINLVAQAMNNMFDEANSFSPQTIFEFPDFFGYDSDSLEIAEEAIKIELDAFLADSERKEKEGVKAIVKAEEAELSRLEEQGASEEKVKAAKAKYKNLLDDFINETVHQRQLGVNEIINKPRDIIKVSMPILNIFFEEN